MRSTWQEVVDSLLRPARPHLERCLGARDAHVSEQRRFASERSRAIEDCERAIEHARAAIFDADDGVVPTVMTDLERRWRKLSRPDTERGWMDLWARVAPPSWTDRKRWRGTEGELRLDAALALAADVDGVEAAEAAIGSLRSALASWGTSVGTRIRWRLFEQGAEQDGEHGAAMLAVPLSAARGALGERGAGAEVAAVPRAHGVEHLVREAALARFPSRPKLARDVAHAAFVDVLWHLVELGGPSPVEPLRQLWMTGYVLAEIDEHGVTLEIPRL